ncbi:MAG: hypothetical protein ABIJ16_05445 [Bacteroidota bacterium]
MRIYFDANMPRKLAHALNIIQEALNFHENTDIEVISTVDVFGDNAPDEVWIPQVTNSIVITQDYRIQRTKHQTDLYQQYGLCMVYLKPPSNKGMSFWEMTKVLINKWDEIRKLSKKSNFPAAYICKPKSKLKELE